MKAWREAWKAQVITWLVAGSAMAGLPPTSLKGELGSKKTTFNFQAPLNQATQVSGTTSLIETDSDNALTNPRFAGGTTGWTASGGSFSASGTTGTWDSSASGQTLTSTAVTVTTGDEPKNQAYSASCRFKTASGTATHKIQLYDGTNVLSEATITSSTDYTRTSVVGIAPSSGSVSLRVISVASNEPSIDIKNCYLGRAEGFNWAQVSQAKFIGSAKIASTASCQWGRTSTTPGTMGTTAACPGPTVIENPGPGTIQTTDTDLPRFTINNLPAGSCNVKFSGMIGGPAADYARVGITDGTTTSSLDGFWGASATNPQFSISRTFTYTDAGNRSFELVASSLTGTVTVYANYGDLTFSVECFPLSTDGVVRADQSPASWSGYHGSDCSWSRTNTAYGDFSADASCTLTQLDNVNFGTVTGSNTTPSITFSPPRAGRYFVCAIASVALGSASTNGAFKLTDGTNDIAEDFNFDNSAANYKRANLCGEWRATSTASATLKIQAKSGAGTAVVDANAYARVINWNIFSLDGPLPQFLIPGSVFSSSAGTIRTEVANITNGGSCAIGSQIGSWVSSVSHPATGQCTLTLSTGVFSAAPICVCSAKDSAFGNCRYASGATSTSATFTTDNTAGSNVDSDFNVICMGPH